jgi:hypothetical protein
MKNFSSLAARHAPRSCSIVTLNPPLLPSAVLEPGSTHHNKPKKINIHYTAGMAKHQAIPFRTRTIHHAIISIWELPR